MRRVIAKAIQLAIGAPLASQCRQPDGKAQRDGQALRRAGAHRQERQAEQHHQASLEHEQAEEFALMAVPALAQRATRGTQAPCPVAAISNALPPMPNAQTTSTLPALA
ncbi:hypothetical protein G6F46_014857 [Rhizopus delemar]|nr:hypothetical protein G6F46_014857 [Rhizopus delemar]